ncbi:MAG: hypothetical protein QOF84_1398 [Streptomyces sp.]|jgi:hypothetical protein|nr:hypothetical protein [Streptomyces sp.]
MTSTEDVHGPWQERPRPRWRRRRVLVPTAALVLLPLIAAGVDYSALKYTEARTAAAFQEATGTAQAPAVHVRGFPVLTQLAGGTLKRVDISARQIPAGSQSPVPISDLDVHLTGLERGTDARSAHAATATATAFVSYRDLSDALGIDIGPASTDGRVAASMSVPLLGELQVTARVTRAEHNGIAFTSVRVSGGQLPASVRQLVEKAFQQTIPLENLPRGLTLDGLSTGHSGITATLSGNDVTFTPDSGADETGYVY